VESECEVSGYYDGPWVLPPSPALTLVLTFIEVSFLGEWEYDQGKEREVQAAVCALSMEVSGYPGVWTSPPALTLVFTFMVQLLSREVGSCFEEEHERNSCSSSKRGLAW
jgi:hypothetical protein